MQIDWEGNATSSTETKRRDSQGQEKEKNRFTYNRFSIWSKDSIDILNLSRIRLNSSENVIK